MKTSRRIWLAAVTALYVVSPAAAQERGPHSTVGLAVKVSTLGVGVDAAIPVIDRANVRVGFNTFTLNHDFDNDGITLAASLRMRSVSAYFDWFAFGGGFHISPGVMLYNGNQLSATMSVPAGQDFELGDETLYSNAANPLTGTFKLAFPKVAPSLLLGWGNIIPHGDRRWSIPVELGIVFSGSPTTTLAFGGSACNRSGGNCRNIASDPTLQADVAREQQKIDDELSVLKIIPVFSIGFSFKF